ncbi:MAG: hypothetical protein IKE22_06920, partial [Atopobiaceae bacterium]|nr:hypothetical protein [Atopobiaceae bacterium]
GSGGLLGGLLHLAVVEVVDHDGRLAEFGSAAVVVALRLYEKKGFVFTGAVYDNEIELAMAVM